MRRRADPTRLDAKKLAHDLGPIDVPVEPLDMTAPAEQQAVAR